MPPVLRTARKTERGFSYPLPNAIEIRTFDGGPLNGQGRNACDTGAYFNAIAPLFPKRRQAPTISDNQ